MTILKPGIYGPTSKNLLTTLEESIIGQDDAIKQIVNVYQMYLAGLNNTTQPIGNFLLLGPTGVGKTYTVERVAYSLLGSESNLTKVDCAEFGHSHEVAKLIGSPPGYLGHRETKAILTQSNIDRHKPYSKSNLNIILFDEIEKASSDFWNLLLGILDKAKLTLGDNTTTDFSRSLIFLTSNAGSEAMAKVTSGYGLGSFVAKDETVSKAEIEAAANHALRHKFTPEFLNRLDATVVYNTLTEEGLREVLHLELDRIQDQIALSSIPFRLKITSGAKDFLLKDGYDPRYGARHLKRALKSRLLQPVSNLIMSGQIEPGDTVKVVMTKGSPAFVRLDTDHLMAA